MIRRQRSIREGIGIPGLDLDFKTIAFFSSPVTLNAYLHESRFRLTDYDVLQTFQSDLQRSCEPLIIDRDMNATIKVDWT